MKSGDLNRATCEKQFVVNALRKGIRLDGRKFYDHREVSIEYGESFGHCEVCIGDTRALAQVSCEIIKPSQNRPNEGQLFLNVELSPMASPAFESGRPSSQAIEINRFVERCLKESRAVDMESLCIIAGEKVWCLRVDVHILDDKGNILDCACISAIAALAHFRRPDVTVSGKDITIHSFNEKEAIPLSVHHFPICISLGFVNSCEKPIVDPTDIEELAIDGLMMVALNSYMEICCAKMCGVAISPEKVVMCCRIAGSRIKEITDKVKNCLDEDRKKRFPNKDRTKKWRIDDNSENNMLKSVNESTRINITDTVKEAIENSKKINKDLQVTTQIILKDKKTATVGEGGSSVWIISDDDVSIDEKEDEMGRKIEDLEKPNGHDIVECIAINDNSEEEETIQITNMDLDFETAKKSDTTKIVIDQSIKIIENISEEPRKKIPSRKRKKRRPVKGS